MSIFRKKWNEARVSLKLTGVLAVVAALTVLTFGVRLAFSAGENNDGVWGCVNPTVCIGDGWGIESSDTLQPPGLSLGGATIGTTISSASTQVFTVGQAATAISAITIREGATPVITAANDIRIRIPGGFPMSWDATDLTAVISGSASAKVSATVSYAGNDKILVLDVTSNFAANESITVSGLSFKNFTALSDGGDNLELDINNDGGADALANKQIWISDQYGRGTGDGWDMKESAAVSLEPPTKLVITTPARTITASTGIAPSAVVTVEAQTSGSVKAGTFYGTVTIASNSGAMKFDTSSTGAFNGTITSLALSAGTGDFYFVDTAKGSPLITVSYTGLTNGTQQQTVNAGSSAQLAFSTQPGGPVAAGANLSPQPVVDIQDQYGNRTGDAAEITLSVLGGTGGTLNAATNPLTSTSGRAVFSGVNYTKVETIQLRASGLGFTADSAPVTIDQPGAASQVVALNPVDGNVDNTISVTFQIQDAYGNLVTSPNESVTVTVDGAALITAVTTGTGDGTYNSNSEAVTSAAGQITVTISNQTAQTVNINVDHATLTNTSTQNVIFDNGAATQVVVINPTDGTVDADIPVTIQVQDQYGNLMDTAAEAVTVMASGAAVISGVTTGTGDGTYNSNSEPVTSVNGVIVVTLHDQTVQTVNITVNHLTLTDTSTQNVVFSAGAAVKLLITSDEPGGKTVGAGDTPATPAHIIAYDRYDNIAAGDTSRVFLSSTSSSMYFYAAQAAADADTGGANGAPTGSGAATFVNLSAGQKDFWFKDTLLGTHTITATTDAGHTTDTDFNGTGSNLSVKTNTAVSGSGPTASVALTGTWVWGCGDPITVNHATGDGITPSSGYAGSITYDTALFNFGGSTGNKCMITRNLGATQQATPVSDSSAASAGWYWQFDKKQGYVAGPTPAWGTNGTDSSWLLTEDPCALLLNPITGGTWHIPTNQEWTDIDASGAGTGTAWTTWSGPFDALATNGTTQLRLHAAGYLDLGVPTIRGSGGLYSSSTQFSSTNGYRLYFSSSASTMGNNNKAFGYNVRCLKD